MARTVSTPPWRTVPVPVALAVALASASLSALSADGGTTRERREVVVEATVTGIRLDQAGRTPAYRVDYVFTAPGRRGAIAGRGWISACRIDMLGPGERLAVLVDPLEPRRSEPWMSGGETGEPPRSKTPLPSARAGPMPVPMPLMASATGGAAMRPLTSAPAARPSQPENRLALGRS